MPITVVADGGSCWNGKREYGYELIKIAKEAGADALKFQLFGQEMAINGNIELSFELFRDFHQKGKEIGIPITASVFNRTALNVVWTLDVPFIKLAYSMQDHTDWLEAGQRIGKKMVVTSDLMNVHKLDAFTGAVKLWTFTVDGKTVYPVHTKLNFERLFPPFHGFSDHTPGEANAIQALGFGATWFETHLTLNYSDITCPDHRFAHKPKEFEKYVRVLKG